jgi:hypothetical protein
VVRRGSLLTVFVVLAACCSVAVAAGGRVYFWQGSTVKQIRPSTLQLTGDGTLAVLKAKWSSWGGAEAKGTGVAEYHGCTPSCAQAKVQNVKVSIVLSGVVPCKGVNYYVEVTLTEPNRKQLDRSFLQSESYSPCSS